MWGWQSGRWTYMKGNTVEVWTDEDGQRWARSQLRGGTLDERGKKKSGAKAFKLPDGMPAPFTEFDFDPGTHRDRFLDGPRRPTWGVKDPKWAILSWDNRTWSNGKNSLLSDWLSTRQWSRWNWQVGCPYCGAGVGHTCVGRTTYYGKTDEMGHPVVRQSVVPYTHKLRNVAVAQFYSELDWKIFPDWLYWSSHQIGEDPDALMAALISARGIDFALDYLARFGPQEQDP